MRVRWIGLTLALVALGAAAGPPGDAPRGARHDRRHRVTGAAHDPSVPGAAGRPYAPDIGCPPLASDLTYRVHGIGGPAYRWHYDVPTGWTPEGVAAVRDAVAAGRRADGRWLQPAGEAGQRAPHQPPRWSPRRRRRSRRSTTTSTCSPAPTTFSFRYREPDTNRKRFNTFVVLPRPAAHGGVRDERGRPRRGPGRPRQPARPRRGQHREGQLTPDRSHGTERRCQLPVSGEAGGPSGSTIRRCAITPSRAPAATSSPSAWCCSCNAGCSSATTRASSRVPCRASRGVRPLDVRHRRSSPAGSRSARWSAALVAGVLADRLGRRFTLVLASVIFVVGALLEALARGRRCWSSADSCSARGRHRLGRQTALRRRERRRADRGRMVSLYQMAVTIGIFSPTGPTTR